MNHQEEKIGKNAHLLEVSQDYLSQKTKITSKKMTQIGLSQINTFGSFFLKDTH